LKWTEERRDNKIFREYRREYKRRFAWIKAGKIEPDAFYAWSERAREKKAECDDGKITPRLQEPYGLLTLPDTNHQ